MDIGIMAGRKKRESGQKVGGPVSRGRGRLGFCQFDETWHRPHPFAGFVDGSRIEKNFS